MFWISALSVRTRWRLFTGLIVVVVLGVTMLAATGQMLLATRDASLVRDQIGAGRFEAASVVVRAQQRAHIPTDDGDTTFDYAPLLLEARRIPVNLTSKVDAVPGVRAVHPDRTFSATLVGGEDGTRAGHGWSSAALAPYRLTEGTEPRSRDEVVLDEDTAKRHNLEPGDRTDVITLGGVRAVKVAGVAKGPGGDGRFAVAAVFFTDQAAAELTGASDQVDAIGVFGEDGTTPEALAEQLRQALGDPSLVVVTGADKLDPATVSDYTSAVTDAGSFLAITALISAFVSIFVVASTFAFVVAQRRRELALLRTVGATPKQVQRMMIGEAAIVGALASAAGCVLGAIGGQVLAGLTVSFGIAPPGFSAPVSPLALTVAFIVGVGVSVLGVFAASRQAGRVAAVEALRQADVEQGVMTRGRWLIGIGFFGLALLMILLMARVGGEASVVFAIVLTEVLVVALAALAPLFVPPLVWLLSRPLTAWTDVTGLLAGANSRVAPRRVAALAAPILITVAIGSSMLGVIATTSATAAADARAHLSAPFVVTAQSGAGLPQDTIDKMKSVPGVVDVTGVVKTSGWAPNLGEPDQVTMGVADPRTLGAVFKVAPASGSLDQFAGASVVVTREASNLLGWTAGQQVTVYLGDGTPAPVTVAAVLSADAGLPDILLSPEIARGHVHDPLTSEAYVLLAPGADTGDVRKALAALPAVEVSTAEDWLTTQSQNSQQDNLIAIALLFGMAILYTGISIANTLAMSMGERTEEIRLMRRIGATGRQITGVMLGEILAVVLVGVVLGLLVAVITIIGVWRGLASTGAEAVMDLPLLQLGGVVSTCVVIALVGGMVPTMRALRVTAAARPAE
ncbi:putative ABC transport system permease protein [Lentzea atacamensis]|uniref:Putative ABC transport system permease protein n=1 Tax=Lentzea atacamensis TaxID=531938 RepID=A0A316HYS1_9PSEU|nr:putative ABC transport system permease protein [Lentzea atacamensis]